MEASAFFNSCERCHVAALGVVKGVSDNGDAEKGDLMYTNALYNSAQAAVGLSKHYVNGTSFPQVPIKLNGAVLAEGYFKNFLRRALRGLLKGVKKVTYGDMEEEYEKKLYLLDPGVDGLSQLVVGEALAFHVSNCNLKPVAIETDEIRPLTLYYKKGKIFDFPTTLNGLVGNAEIQINYDQFKSTVLQLAKEMGVEDFVKFIPIKSIEKLWEQA